MNNTINQKLYSLAVLTVILFGVTALPAAAATVRCDLDVSDERIERGEEVELAWETSNARDIRLEDNHGNVLLDTDDLDNDEKDDFLDGELTVKPREDTTYTLIAERGSSDKECEVEVEVTGSDDDDEVVVYEYRSQESVPVVSGIYLSSVPYTGFEAGPMLTAIFYGVLTIWALFMAYLLVIRRDTLFGFSLAGTYDHVAYQDVTTPEADPVTHVSEAEEYVHSVVAEEPTIVPHNLPVADDTVGPVVEFTETIEDFTALENRAHAQQVLLSSDAMRFFVGQTEEGEQLAMLDAVIAKAKHVFSSEDGWTVLNLSRMESLFADADEEAVTPGDTTEEVAEVEVVAAPMTGGSLAEAILSGNVVAAYKLIEHRPMVALADAATELDTLYRARKGESVKVSHLLDEAAHTLTAEQLEAAIQALTGALDGTYNDEASAVKMAIMKAVQAIA